jgi:hypothetical protein
MSAAQLRWSTGTLVAALAATFTLACSSPAKKMAEEGGTGGSEETGGKSGGSTGGKSGGDTGGKSGGDTGGKSGGDTGGKAGGDTGGAGGGSTGGAGGSTGGMMGSTGGMMGGTGGAMMPPSAGLPTCTTEPAASAPALKKTAVVRIPNGDQAGQVIGFPGEKGIYIIGHRSGKLFYAEGGMLNATPMATVAIKNNAGQDEQGMLGVAMHPNFTTNHLFYLFYTAPNGNIKITEHERMTMTSSMEKRVIWDKPRTGGGAFHNGGQIWFNPKDGGKPLLYHAVGNNSNIGTSGAADGVSGRVLIHDLSAEAVTSKTMSFGLRNPYRMTIDRLSGDMYIGEIDDPPGGAIYGSAVGSPVKDYGYRGGGIKGGLTGKEGGRAIIGGQVYRGLKIPGACGRYFYAGWPGGEVKSMVVKDGKNVGAAATHAGVGTGGIASFGEDGEGELYYATQGGEVYKIEAM